MPTAPTFSELTKVLDESRARRSRGGLVLEREGAQLPLWEDDSLRGLPNCLARGALFTCRGKNVERRDYEDELITSTSGMELRLKGQEFRQDDEDVWLQLIHMARAHRLGDRVEVSAYQLLRALEWTTGGREYARLRACMKRLKTNTLTVTRGEGRDGFMGNLIKEIAWSDAGGGANERWYVELSSRLVDLFRADDFSLVDWEQRLMLRPLAKWLHSYYSGHKEPYPVSVERLYALSGSGNKRLSGFRRDLVGALEELVRVRFLTLWRLNDASDLVTVAKAASRLRTIAA